MGAAKAPRSGIKLDMPPDIWPRSGMSSEFMSGMRGFPAVWEGNTSAWHRGSLCQGSGVSSVRVTARVLLHTRNQGQDRTAVGSCHPSALFFSFLHSSGLLIGADPPPACCCKSLMVVASSTGAGAAATELPGSPKSFPYPPTAKAIGGDEVRSRFGGRFRGAVSGL